MYQWWLAEEQLDLIRARTRVFTDAERQRMELLEEMAAAKPSLLARLRNALRAQPQFAIERTLIDTDVLGGFIEDGTARRAA